MSLLNTLLRRPGPQSRRSNRNVLSFYTRRMAAAFAIAMFLLAADWWWCQSRFFRLTAPSSGRQNAASVARGGTRLMQGELIDQSGVRWWGWQVLSTPSADAFFCIRDDWWSASASATPNSAELERVRAVASLPPAWTGVTLDTIAAHPSAASFHSAVIGWPWRAWRMVGTETRSGPSISNIRVIEGIDLAKDLDVEWISDRYDKDVIERWFPDSNLPSSMIATHPLWPGLLANAAVLVAIGACLVMLRPLVRVWTMRRAARRGLCPRCRYPLPPVAPTADRCPECGGKPTVTAREALLGL